MVAIRFLLLHLTILVCFQSHAVDSLTNCKLDDQHLPICKGSSLLIDKTIPAQMVYIQDLRADNLIPILENIEGTPTKIKIPYNGYKYYVEDLQNDPYKLALLKKAMAQGRIVTDNITTEDPSKYVRDSVIYSYDPLKNVIIKNRDPLHDDFLPTQANANSICGIKVVRKDFTRTNTDDERAIDSLRGGNILAMPGGNACVTSLISPDSFGKEICGNNAKLVRIDTRFARIGHVDEIINFVPNKNNSCGFSVVMGSTERTLNLLKKNPNELFFSEQGSEKIDQASGRTCRNKNICYRIKDFCSEIKSYRALKILQNKIRTSKSNYDTKTGVSKLELLINLIDGSRSQALMLRVNEETEKLTLDDINKHYPILANSAKPSDQRSCETATNKEIVDILNASENLSELSNWLDENSAYFKEQWQKNNCEEKHTSACVSLQETDYYKVSSQLEQLKNIGIANKNYQQIQEKNWQIIKDSLPDGCKSDDIRVDVPSFYYNNHSLNPNPTNLEIIGNGIAMPMQFNKSMDNDYQAQIKTAGMNPIMINTFAVHEGGGNVHCRSNEIRICKRK